MVAVIVRVGTLVALHGIQVLRGDHLVEATVVKALVKCVYLTVSPLLSKDINDSGVAETLEDTQSRVTPSVANSGILVIHVDDGLSVGQLCVRWQSMRAWGPAE